MKKTISILTTIILLCTITMPLYAKSIDDLKNEKQQINKENNDAKNALNNAQAEKNTVFNEIQTLDTNINKVEGELTNLSVQLEETNLRLTSSEQDLAQARIDKENQYETLKKRIKIIYEKGNTGYLDILINFTSFTNLLNKIEYVNDLITYDNGILDKMKLTEETIKTKITEIEVEKKTVELLKKDQEDKKHTLEESIAQKKQVMTKLTTDINEYQNLIAENEKNERALEADIKKKEEEIARKAREEAARKAREEAARKEAARKKAEEQKAAAAKAAAAAKTTAEKKAAADATAKANAASKAANSSSSSSSTSSSSYTGGKLGWPLPGYSANSGMGGRVNPITGKRETHRGMDIAAPKGTTVYAAESGTVITAQYLNSYGNAIIISHGNGISTLYGHNSKLLVSQGQSVKRGQAIAQVGSTGDSTGNHLHFEVRKNGEYTNPSPYI